MEDLALYKLADELSVDGNINGMFIKAVLEQMEYMKNYNLSLWSTLKNPIFGYCVTDTKGNEIYYFKVDYCGRYADFPIRCDEKNLYVRTCMYNGGFKYTEIEISIEDLRSCSLNIIPLRKDEYWNKVNKEKESLFNM